MPLYSLIVISVRHLPEWLPGMSFKRRAREWSKPVAAFTDKPYAFVQHQMVCSPSRCTVFNDRAVFQATGKSIDCFVSDCIEKGISNKLGDEIVKRVSSSMYAGGADTVR